jgi:hypothetical protein
MLVTKPFWLSTTTSMFPALLHPKNLAVQCTGVDLIEGIYITHLIDIGKEKGTREREKEREKGDGAFIMWRCQMVVVTSSSCCCCCKEDLQSYIYSLVIFEVLEGAGRI